MIYELLITENFMNKIWAIGDNPVAFLYIENLISNKC